MTDSCYPIPSGAPSWSFKPQSSQSTPIHSTPLVTNQQQFTSSTPVTNQQQFTSSTPVTNQQHFTSSTPPVLRRRICPPKDTTTPRHTRILPALAATPRPSAQTRTEEYYDDSTDSSDDLDYELSQL